ncbi:mechanosensitive ion channel family protein [Thermosulfurimonas sp. F29]|uniref:mechanosensitive ion channel family protein n=1 Tax=Thermosulfurimonas sp. F29 TaxID=2867247 RepID=UPI001C8300B2|nr:mechanosensitive ion channel domain-containing protein [Thermosulfurimonas sp. F29]MBX6422995.1 mechanosensitive ion channel [Thermosulfurimonas sp. F29]
MGTLKRILTYPLWQTGGITFTLLGFIKFLLILGLGVFFLRYFRRRAERFFIGRFQASASAINSLTTLIYYALLVILLLVALSSAGLNLTQVGLIFGALGVGIGFGLQTITSNFISGIILLTEGSLRVGDLVELEDGTLGVVKEINMRSTVLRTFDGQDLIVPNSEFVSKRISTWTYEDDWRRIHIPFGVAYGSDPELVKRVVTEAARKVPLTQEDADHPLQVWFTGFGDSALEFSLAVWIRQSQAKRALTGIKSDYYYAIHRALIEAGIEIPFPQRDLHLKSLSGEAIRNLKTLVGGGHG